ncbi:MAG: AAA family ATPase [Muribaculaceae bacterium]
MNNKIRISPILLSATRECCALATLWRHEYLTPEHLLFSIASNTYFADALFRYRARVETVVDTLKGYLENIETVPADEHLELHISVYLDKVRKEMRELAGAEVLDVPHLIRVIFNHPEMHAYHALSEAMRSTDPSDQDLFLKLLERSCPFNNSFDDEEDEQTQCREFICVFGDEECIGMPIELALTNEVIDDDDDVDAEEDGGDDDDDENYDRYFGHAAPYTDEQSLLLGSNEISWRDYVKPIKFDPKKQNPLIGREAEIARTLQVLCRKEKNNPLHLGDPGVGKTAIIYGLVEMINHDKVPDRLIGTEIYQLDLSSLVSGTQYRGEFEKRVKAVMDGLVKEGNAIVYIDGIHNIVGTGATGDSHVDAANLLKPYFENSGIQFIGSTTFADYKRSLANSQSITRYFQQIDILEPSINEAVNILMGLKSRFEKFHGVTYTDDAIEYAVKASARYINNRALPDKAIDLIDEAGAYLELNPDDSMTVTKNSISQVLAKICKVEHLADSNADDERLDTLYERINAKIYGQDEALKSVVEAVQMSRAGLLEENKPVASLLFVGPTGVGKTEVARVLAHEMGMNLVRFDMSEYAEKHAVAKLIGSPAGYVGYDDGGLLTDAIRRTPNCVLLLDEIEKAHPDIYNILLQVMDYASLTDNHGNKADFRHVILIMTSNAGAQHAGKPAVGFNSTVRRGDVMAKAVKSTFKPEFINRLSSVVVFNDLSRHMAELILEKRINELSERLKPNKIMLSISSQCREWLLDKGFTPEYGARELDRVISHSLKTKLMREILFGELKNGGNASVDIANGELIITTTQPKNDKQQLC